MAFPALGALTATTFLVSLALCGVIRSAARRLRLVDVPNERSLHKVPVPRLGGVAIIVSAAIALIIAGWSVPRFERSDTPWVVGAALIALLGLADDLRHLPALVRLLVQLAVAAGVLWIVLRTSDVNVAAGVWMRVPRPVGVTLSVIFVVGTTNIFNFMDGMDGLAATQTMSAALALAVCAAAAGQLDVAFIALILAATGAGFFVHNSPPATIFLGDAGSTFLGFTFSCLAVIAATRPSPVPIAVVPTALAPFLLDGTFTILRRLSRRERVWQAHRTHLYQRAVATGLSHRDVLVVYAGWSAVAATAAMLLSRWDETWMLATGAVMLVPLVGVWRWVVSRETHATPAGS